MKINEVTQNAKISRVVGNKVTVDHGDGTETTIDTDKNPDALSQGDKPNELDLNQEPANSSMNKKTTAQVRPGQRVSVKQGV